MGAMGDLGVHKSDLIRWLLDDEVAQVAAFVGTLHKEGTDVDDNATCLLRMKSGATGSLVASWTYYKGQDNSTVLWCENGVIKIDTDPNDQVIVELRDGTVERYKVGQIATNEKQTASGVIDEFVTSILNGTKASYFRRRRATAPCKLSLQPSNPKQQAKLLPVIVVSYM